MIRLSDSQWDGLRVLSNRDRDREPTYPSNRTVPEQGAVALGVLRALERMGLAYSAPYDGRAFDYVWFITAAGRAAARTPEG